MEKRKIVVIREELLSDRRLSLAERIVCARISAFESYFESAENCAELLGISVSTVQKAKAKLEKLGYILCIKNTGRGKVYRANLDVLSDSQNLSNRLADSANQNRKICEHSIDREENEFISKEIKAQEPTSEYGNKDINAIFKAWTNAGLPEIVSRAQANRRAVWNMLRNKSIGRDKLLHYIELVARSQSDPYAPGVPDLETLSRRIGAIETWERRQKAKADAEAEAEKPVHERRPYDGRPEVLDREQINDERVTPEFLAQCRKKFVK